MKKFILLLFCLAVPLVIMSQKSMSSVGANILMGIGKSNIWAGTEIKYQYNLSDYFRMEIACSYSLLHSSKTYIGDNNLKVEEAFVAGQAFVNTNIFLCSPRTIRPYIIAGTGWLCYRYTSEENFKYDNPESYKSALGFNVGLGLNYRLSYHWSMQVEAKGLYPLFTRSPLYAVSRTGNHQSFKTNIGLTYNF